MVIAASLTFGCPLRVGMRFIVACFMILNRKGTDIFSDLNLY